MFKSVPDHLYYDFLLLSCWLIFFTSSIFFTSFSTSFSTSTSFPTSFRCSASSSDVSTNNVKRSRWIIYLFYLFYNCMHFIFYYRIFVSIGHDIILILHHLLYSFSFFSGYHVRNHILITPHKSKITALSAI